MLRTGCCRRLACALGALLVAASAHAASTSFRGADSQEEFESGRGSGVSLTADGRVVIAPLFDATDIEGAQYAWEAERAGRDGFYVVTGTPGALHIVRDGRVESLFEVATADLPALAVGPDGEAYVGTAPGGKVYRVSRDGASELFFDSEAGYVWSMDYSPEHGLIVGTGEPARVYAVDARGRAEVLYDSNESSVTAIASVGGRVLAGTSGEGLLVDVTPGSDVAVLYDTPHDEVVGVAPGGDGRIYFAASSIMFDQAFDETDDYGAGMGDGSVYSTTPAGGAVEVWRSVDSPLASLGRGPGGEVWAGTGTHGLVHSFALDGSRSLVSDLDCEEILSIAGGSDGAVVTAGIPARVYVVGPEIADSGTYESDVIDAGGIASWGEASWRFDGADGSLYAESRSGNTASPDATWSDWSSIDGRGEGRIESPSARFLQWRFTLHGRGAALRSMEVAFVRENLPPKVQWVAVHEAADLATDGGGNSMTGSIRQTLPGGIEVTYSLEPRADAGHLPSVVRGLRAAEWDAFDPDGDPLSYDLEIRGPDDEAWHTLVSGIEWRTVHTWDTASMADGEYRLRVLATDAPGNPPELALTASGTSEPFIVDNGPPEIVGSRVKRERDRVTVQGEVKDALSAIARVDVAVNYGEWQPAFAVDGVFDSRGEEYSASLEVPQDEAISVTTRAIDGAGNIAVSRRTVR